MKKHLFKGIGVLVLITIILLYPSWPRVFHMLKEIPRRLFVQLFLLQIITILLSNYIWYVLLKREISFFRVLSIYLTGSLMESITPAVKLGGEAVKVYLFHQFSNRTIPDLLATLLVQKYISLLPFLFLCSIILLIAPFTYPLPSSFYLGFLLLLSICILLFYQKKGKGEKYHLFGPLKRLKHIKVKAKNLLDRREGRSLLVISFIIWALYPMKVYIVANALKGITHPLHSAISTFVAYLVSMIPLLPGGIGSFEGTLAYLFTLTGNSQTKGLAIALASRSITFYGPLLLSLIALPSLLTRKNNKMIHTKPLKEV